VTEKERYADSQTAPKSHFTRVFKRLIGTTPAVFRREHGSNERPSVT